MLPVHSQAWAKKADLMHIISKIIVDVTLFNQIWNRAKLKTNYLVIVLAP